ncbi:hypothetical protein EUTSA_v10027311mg [Eutrema salsugineum]|uniref:Uncharacterized protein n=1 Tax=Eutrema salsugineum TaxID=72664 RepID=V4P470_EUTSA|nr:spermidine coumaroyl-CoA acyltransferase [Eutrema salsugineum]ESQ54261.1 hypothetical protein EUTSA_v10027311mg [Eutrema salsugineum]
MVNQTNSSLPLSLQKKSTEVVIPSKHTPSGNLSLSSLDNNPLNEARHALVYVFEANEKNQNDPVSLLRKALSELLVYYYPLSGRLVTLKSDRKFELVCNGEGVPFTVATAAPDLRSLNYIQDFVDEFALHLVPEIEFNYESEIGYPPLAMQVTKFPCGGFTIGTSSLHAVCDGAGVARFIHSLAELAGGKSEPSVVPVWQRERLVMNIDNEPARVPAGAGARSSLLATSPYMPSSDLVTEIISIKAGNIRMLKAALVRECEFQKENYTTYEILSACLWKSRSRALNLDLDKITVLGIIVGIGHVLDPPLSEGYYGNSIIDVYIELTTRELHEASISDIVKLVKRAKKKAYDRRYVEEVLRNTERMIKEDVKFGDVIDGSLFMTDMRNVGVFGSMDFGWNEPVNLRGLMFEESAKNMGMILRPSKLDPAMEGGVRVVMTFPRDAMVKFKQEMDDMMHLRSRF